MNRRVSVFHVMFVIIRIIGKAAPLYIGIVLLAGLFHGIFKGLETLCMQRFFDDMTYLGMSQAMWKNVFISFLLLAGAIILGQIFNGIHNAMIELSSFKVMGAMSGSLHEKTSMLRTEFYENADNLDCLQKAEKGIEQGTFFLNVCFNIATYYIPYFVFMGVYLAFIRPTFIWTIVLVLFRYYYLSYIGIKCLTNLRRNRQYMRENTGIMRIA